MVQWVAIPQINVMATAFLATLREHKQTMFAINTLFHLYIGLLRLQRSIRFNQSNKKTNRTNHNRRMKNKKHSHIFASAPRAPLTDDTMPGTRLLAGLLRIWSHLMIMRILMMIKVMRMRMIKELIAGLLSIWPQLAGFFVISIISSS